MYESKCKQVVFSSYPSFSIEHNLVQMSPTGSSCLPKDDYLLFIIIITKHLYSALQRTQKHKKHKKKHKNGHKDNGDN